MAYYNNPYNNGFNNNGFMNGQGMQFNPNFQQKQVRNILTDDEIQELMKTGNQFSLAITEKDKKRAVCNHRMKSKDGSQDALIDNPDGTVSCAICGYTFKPLTTQVTTPDVIKGSVNDILDLLQTIKLIYFDIDGNVAREYFQIIPLIEKIPMLFEIAVKNYTKHENFSPWDINNRNMATLQGFSMLRSMLEGGGFGNMYQNPQQGFQQQQYYNPNFQQMNNPGGMYQQQPMDMNQPNNNGFGYMGAGMAPGGYQAQTNGYQTMYGQPQQQMDQSVANTQQPDAASVSSDGSTKTVTASFKA